MTRTIVVNLYGAPGSGKSTGAAYIFSRLKMFGINCEMSRKYVKEVVWARGANAIKGLNQEDIFYEQAQRLIILIGKVDVIITDSPLEMSNFYDSFNLNKKSNYCLNHEWKSKIVEMNFFIKRAKSFEERGRAQTKMEADLVNDNMKKFLAERKVNFYTIDGKDGGYDFIVDRVTRIYREFKACV